MARKSVLNPTSDPDVVEIREEYDFYKTQWADIRRLAAIDMLAVKGDPFTKEEWEEREERPTIAPEEMSQYRNQVTNSLRANPRGVKFQPAGNGADTRSAEFYQGKMREIEYRCHAVEAYIGGAENVLQRGYGAWRIKTEYESPRSPNQEISIEGFPDPDVVLPDPEAKRRTSEDMKGCYVLETLTRKDFKRRFGKQAKVTNFEDYARFSDWIIGSQRVQVAERWKVETTERQLFAVVLAAQVPGRGGKPGWKLANKPMFVFEDELEALNRQVQRSKGAIKVASQRKQRMVDYPQVTLQITNGLEVLHEEDWPGKYIPIVTLYGPILYVPEGGEVKKTILSMTRFGLAPWKAYCYACSQELEVLGMVPHGSVMAVAGQLANFEDDWEESLHKPKLVLYYKDSIPGMPADAPRLGPPQRLAYTQGEYLQAIELVKEGYRRAIQASMGSNFLPTQAQHINDKSGKALEKIDQAATQGTYHFVDAYEDGIRHTGVIIEDLIDKIHDYTGETGTMSPKLEAKSVRINDPKDPEAFSTRGDHLVTVSTAPSSDSEYDAVKTFIEHMITNLQVIAGIAGPKVAAAILAQSIQMQNLGPMGDELADFVRPEEFKSKDGKPPDPQLLAAKGQIQQLTQQLQQMGMVIHTKQVEGQTKFQIEKYKTDATSQDKAADREVKLFTAEMQDKLDRMWLFMEESKLVGARLDARAERVTGQAHDSIERAKDRTHDRHSQSVEHAAAAALAAQAGASDAAGREQQASIDADAAASSQAHEAAQADADRAAAAESASSDGE